MCGITGVYNYKTSLSIEESIISKMNSVMHHRGPDDEGIYIDENIGLGHKRLSIIDLSVAGHQPISNEDNSIWLVFNGEVYNYLELIPELKAKGHIFKSKTDTEVILHGYEEWGIDCIHRFNGMFAFALWDKTKKRLILIRDRLGVKPLYYTENSDGIVFASEIKAILQHPQHKINTADPVSLYNYVNEGFLTGNKTLYNNIYKLHPGHFLIIEKEEIKEHTYWKLGIPDIESELTEKDINEQLRELLKDAVNIRLRSDVPIGFHLSGGLDSSAIVSIASKFFDVDMRTFSGRFSESPEYDESKFISVVVNDSGTNHSEVIPEIGKNFPEDVRRMIHYLDEPVAGPGVLPQYEVAKLVKDQGVTVVLGGQGADEILGGYRRFLLSYLDDLKIANNRKYFFKYTNWPNLFSNSLTHTAFIKENLAKVFITSNVYNDENFKNNLFTSEVANLINQDNTNRAIYLKEYPELLNCKSTKLAKQMHYEVVNYLQSLLHIEDRTSMAVSLESRTPFIDYRIVELAAKVPSFYKLKNLSTKYLLRESMNGIMPEPIRQRKDKKGFPTPIDVWFRTTQKDFLRDILYSDSFKNRGIYNIDFIHKLFEEHQKGKNYSVKLWYILNTEIWFREFIDFEGR